MELKLNETPVRTSRNFNINNIKIKNIELNKTNQEFKNTEIMGTDIKNSDDIEIFTLTYGLNEKLEKEVKENSNKKIKIIPQNNANITIKNTFDKQNMNLIDNLQIIVNEGIKANIVIKYNTKEDEEYYHNGIIRVKAQKASNINITIVNLLNMKSNNFISIENQVEENATINYNIIDFGGKHSITNYYSNLERKSCQK